jgi:thiamine pyrophosphokinase
MTGTIASARRVTLLGAGDVLPGALAQALARAPVLIAADGGGDRALAEGMIPERVIGDLDSLSTDGRARLADRLWHIPAQDDTDLDKALDRIAAPLILALGFTGGRLDHTLAAISALGRRPGLRAVLWGAEDLAFVLPPALELALPPGSRLSLWPVAPVRVASAGLVWPTDGLELAPLGRIGTSNAVAEGGAVRLVPEAPGLVCMVPVRAVDAVLAGLSAAPVWPGSARAR